MSKNAMAIMVRKAPPEDPDSARRILTRSYLAHLNHHGSERITFDVDKIIGNERKANSPTHTGITTAQPADLHREPQ